MLSKLVVLKFIKDKVVLSEAHYPLIKSINQGCLTLFAKGV